MQQCFSARAVAGRVWPGGLFTAAWLAALLLASTFLQAADVVRGPYGKTLPRAANQGGVYVVAGNASRVKPSGALDHPAMAVNERELGLLLLAVTGDTVDARLINTDGSTPDDFSIDKGPGGTAGAELAAAAGNVRFFVDAKSNFDRWTKQPSETSKAWMRANYYRMQAYSPYFDRRLAWYPNAWVYKDSYALKPAWPVTSEHPEWVLRDSSNAMLYIPYACRDGSCSQYAADFGNQEFRNWWFDGLAEKLNAGYIGVWVDDVNLKWRIGNGRGNFVNPIDPRTGKKMTFADYQRYFAEFMEQLRNRFPYIEIAHNIIWWTQPADSDGQYLERQILAADYINLERGVTDKGIVGGTGRNGFETFLKFIDRVHSLNRNVILDDDDSDTRRERNLELAVYFLVNNGGDLIGADGDRARMNPEQFWPGYYTKLGAARGKRYKQDNIFRRDFACGIVLVNQPGQRARTIDLGEAMTDLDGNTVRSVTLRAAEGQVLKGTCRD